MIIELISRFVGHFYCLTER